MNPGVGRSGATVKKQLDDRIGKFRLIENRGARRDVFDLELNAFETGCVMRWLERRWSRPAELAGCCFIVENRNLHVQYCVPEAGAVAPITFEAWMRKLARMADQ